MDLSRALNLIDVSAPASESVGGCGSDGCGCGHGGSATTQTVATASSATVVGVTGMTCSHCVSSVTEELSEVEGVASVTVNLVENGTSTVSVHSAAPLSIPVLEAAIAEAGYTVVADPA